MPHTFLITLQGSEPTSTKLELKILPGFGTSYVINSQLRLKFVLAYTKE